MKMPGADFWGGVQDFVVTMNGVIEVDRPVEIQGGKQPEVVKGAKKRKCLEKCVVLNNAFHLRKQAILKKIQ